MKCMVFFIMPIFLTVCILLGTDIQQPIPNELKITLIFCGVLFVAVISVAIAFAIIGKEADK